MQLYCGGVVASMHGALCSSICPSCQAFHSALRGVSRHKEYGCMSYGSEHEPRQG